jgi:2-amino-4-hydroxy-6-hydroxymethyldihydropteridine diphosphokinase
MVTAYIALGSNLGEPAQSVQLARLAVGGIPQTKLDVASSLYKSKPIDASGGDYVNAVVKIDTSLTAYELLAELQKLESLAGRASPKDRTHLHNAPRTLDLDILLYGEACINSITLTIPHPRMRSRAFVLLPLAEIEPALVSAVDLLAVQNQAIYKLPP